MEVPWKRKQTVLEKEIDAVDSNLATLNPLTEGAEYEQLLHIREELGKQKNAGKLNPDTVARIAATFGLVGLICIFESCGHIFTSASKSFLPKIL